MSTAENNYSCCGTQTEVAMDDIRTYSDRELKERSCMVFTVLKEIITSDQFLKELTTVKFAGIFHFLMAAFKGSSDMTELLQGLDDEGETYMSRMLQQETSTGTSHVAEKFDYCYSTSDDVPRSKNESAQNNAVRPECGEGERHAVHDAITVKEEVFSEQSEGDGEVPSEDTTSQQLVEDYIQNIIKEDSSGLFEYEVPNVCSSGGEELMSWDQVESHNQTCQGTSDGTSHQQQDSKDIFDETSQHPVLKAMLKHTISTEKMENISSSLIGEDGNQSVGPARNEQSVQSLHECKTCGKQFSHKTSLMTHMRIHTAGQKSFVCYTCGKSFQQQASLNCHMRIHTGGRIYECKVCGKIYAMKSVLRQHMSQHNRLRKTFSCKQCSFRCVRSVDLINHLKTHPGPGKNNVCQYCEKKFSTPSALITHVRIHTGEKPYKCSTCGVCFAQQGHLTYHWRIHTGEKPYICQVCGQRFTRKKLMLHHLLTHTDLPDFVCDKCGCGFTKISQLQNHMLEHSGKTPFTCTVCREVFNEVETLKNHMATRHPVEAKYQCEICGKTFLWEGHLTNHERSHTGNFKHGCKLCRKNFSGKIALERHLRTHTGEKPFLCSTCGKSYREKGALTVHIRTHTGEKPYACPTCAMPFTRMNDMKRHSVRRHGKIF